MEPSGRTATALGLVAGEAVWSDVDVPPTALERLTALTELAGLCTVAASLWLMASARWPEPTGLAWYAPFAGTLAAGLLASRPLRILTGHQREARLWPSIAWRSAAAIVLGASLVANAPRWGAVLCIPLGIAFGAEAVLCAWKLGVPVDAVRWYRELLVSPLNLGALGAVAAAVVRLGWSDGLRPALTYYVVLHLLAIVVCASAGAFDQVRSQQDLTTQLGADAIVAAEHRSRAHWLHDDVCSQLRIVSLRVQNQAVSTADVVRMLDELDHTLRLRQLDQLLDSGSASLAEIIQPYVRSAQSNGATITSVPSFEEASLVVGTDTGRMIARVVSIFTANALQAGAASMGFQFRQGHQSLVVSVSDDAGGFDLAGAPAGRGLWQLSSELGRDRVHATRTEHGTVMTATIPLDGGSDGDTATC